VRPVIVLCAPAHRAVLESEFGRYTRDYDLLFTVDVAGTTALLRRLRADHVPVPLVVTESQLPDGEVMPAFGAWRAEMPSARRLVAAAADRFGLDAAPLRPGLAKGKFDAYLLMPRGPRDEEFHTAVTELLSDWGSTVPTPEAPSVDIVAPSADPVTVAVRDFLSRMGMESRVLAPDSAEAAPILAELPGNDVFPVVRAKGRPTVAARSVRDVAVTIYGSPGDVVVDDVVDLAIVGAGPAGLAAAVYGSSEGLRTVALEAEAIGGQAGTSSMIRNYLGFPRGVSGMRLAQRARNQAIRFGTQFFTGWPVEALEPGVDGAPHRLVTGGGTVRARAVVISSGVTYRRLGVPALEELVGSGVFYGAAASTARELDGADVVVVGGGNSAGQAAIHLARFARSVTLVVRRPDLGSTMSAYLVREIEYNDVISVLPCTEVVDGGGDERLEWLRLRDVTTGVETRRPVAGLFLLIGADPHCGWLPAEICLDERGFVLTGRDIPRRLWRTGVPPADLATSVPGVFAAGDVRAGSMKRVASATGEGASVVALVHAYLAAA
jgi:thioredoxin reductase (NADPH)